MQKFLAESGVASRRASEQIILAGRVSVNGAPVSQLGTKVDPQGDQVRVDGRPVRARNKLYIALNKPRGYICSRAEEEPRDKIASLLPAQWKDLFSVGRLDYNSEGLIFLTNDGDFCLKLTHPRYGIAKTYIAKVQGRVSSDTLKKFTQGLVSASQKLVARRARLLRTGESSSVVELELCEGKNREVRRLFESQWLSLRRLVRVQIGPVKLGALGVGKWRRLTKTEVQALLGCV